MKYLIIGLGNFGSVMATELSALGHEVIGADNNLSRVDRIKDSITTAYHLDASDSLALSALPVTSVDVVIVAVGENFGASIKIVALLKQLKAQHIYARAIDLVHKAILEAFNVEKILTPEADSARVLVHSMDLGVGIEAFQVDEQYYILKFCVPKPFVGVDVNSLLLEKEFNIKIIGVKRARYITNFLGVSVLSTEIENNLQQPMILTEQDELVCYGRYKDFQKLWRAV